MKITCVADLHGFYPKLDGGDLLIIAGDLTSRDEIEQYEEFSDWLKAQEYRKKIFISGNHDNRMTDKSAQKYFCPIKRNYEEFEYLCDSGTEFEGLKIWGSPWTKTFEGINPKCCAFTVDTEEELAAKFALIPEDTDILITHSPPFGILDHCSNGHVGSKSLRSTINRIKPKIHIFGHIHENGGTKVFYW